MPPTFAAPAIRVHDASPAATATDKATVAKPRRRLDLLLEIFFTTTPWQIASRR
jgi:hypothetical protein